MASDRQCAVCRVHSLSLPLTDHRFSIIICPPFSILLFLSFFHFFLFFFVFARTIFTFSCLSFCSSFVTVDRLGIFVLHSHSLERPLALSRISKREFSACSLTRMCASGCHIGQEELRGIRLGCQQRTGMSLVDYPWAWLQVSPG